MKIGHTVIILLIVTVLAEKYCTNEKLLVDLTVDEKVKHRYESTRTLVKVKIYDDNLKATLIKVNFNYGYCPTSEMSWLSKCESKDGQVRYSEDALINMKNENQCMVGKSCNQGKCSNLEQHECFNPNMREWLNNNEEIKGTFSMDLFHWRCSRSYMCNIQSRIISIRAVSNNQLRIMTPDGLHCTVDDTVKHCQSNNGWYIVWGVAIGFKEESHQLLCVTGKESSMCHDHENGEDLAFDEQDMSYVDNKKYYLSHTLELIHERIHTFPEGVVQGLDLERVYRTLQFENLNTNLNFVNLERKVINMEKLLQSMIVGLYKGHDLLEAYTGLSMGNISWTNSTMEGRICREIERTPQYQVQVSSNQTKIILFEKERLSLVDFKKKNFHLLNIPEENVPHYYNTIEKESMTGGQLSLGFWQSFSDMMVNFWNAVESHLVLFNTICNIIFLFKVKLF